MPANTLSPVKTDFLTSSANTRYLFAAKWGTLDEVKAAIAEGADILAYSDHEEVREDALLRAATSSPDVEVIEYLIDLGLDKEDRSHLSSNLLPVLAQRGFVKLLERLHGRGMNVDSPGAHGVTALMAAAASGQSVSIEVLIECGASLEARDENGATALHRARDAQTIQQLLAAGAGIEAKTKIERTPIFHCIPSLGIERLKQFASHGANIEVSDIDGSTPLLAAAEFGSVDEVAFLLDSGASIETADNSGKTPLIAAASRNSLAVVEELIRRGADLEACDQEGDTALLCAALAGKARAEVLLSLLNAGANRHATNVDGHTVATILERHPEVHALYNAWRARTAILSQTSALHKASANAQSSGQM